MSFEGVHNGNGGILGKGWGGGGEVRCRFLIC